MTGIRIEDGKITAKVWGQLDPDMIEVSDYYEGQVGDVYADLDEQGRPKEYPGTALEDPERVALMEEANKLLMSLEQTRYHLDIAQELGEPVWPEILDARKRTRSRLNEIRMTLNDTE